MTRIIMVMTICARFALPALAVTRAVLLMAGTMSGLLVCALPACAQVSTHLEALPDAPSSRAVPRKAEPAKQAGDHANRHAPASPSAQKSTAKSPSSPPSAYIPAGYTKVPALPSSPPSEPVLAPAFVPIEKHPPAPPAEVIAVDHAGTTTQSLEKQGLRIIFVRGDAALSSDTITSLQSLGQILAQYPAQRLLLKSYANLPGEDISMPRRLALSRALAVRSVLMSAGIASTRLYPIAYGRPVGEDGQPVSCQQEKEATDSDTDSHRNPCTGNYLDILIEENPPITAENFPKSKLSGIKEKTGK